MMMFVPKDAAVMAVQGGARTRLSKDEIMDKAQDHATRIVQACGPEDALCLSMVDTKIVASIVHDACGPASLEHMLKNGNEFVEHVVVAVVDERDVPKA
jgi:hypothetical protein